MNEREYFEACNGEEKYYCLQCGIELDFDEIFCGQDCMKQYYKDYKPLESNTIITSCRVVNKLGTSVNIDKKNLTDHLEKFKSIQKTRKIFKFLGLFFLINILVILVWLAIKYQVISFKWLPVGVNP